MTEQGKAEGLLHPFSYFFHHGNGEENEGEGAEARIFFVISGFQGFSGPIKMFLKDIHHCHGEESKFKSVQAQQTFLPPEIVFPRGRISDLSLFEKKGPFCENLVSQMLTCFSYSDI